MEEERSTLEKIYPQYYVKGILTEVGSPFQDIISLGDRKIYLSVSDGVLYANSIVSRPTGNYIVASTKKGLYPNFSPRQALDNARNSILKRIEERVQDLQKNPFGQNLDVKLNREILEGTHDNNLGNFLARLVTSEEIKVAN
ncbi:MAG: hypothetical protein WC511_04575 [Candidatus Pacearchaeota archaeon]|jgi:hypothetical protein